MKFKNDFIADSIILALVVALAGYVGYAGISNMKLTINTMDTQIIPAERNLYEMKVSTLKVLDSSMEIKFMERTEATTTAKDREEEAGRLKMGIEEFNKSFGSFSLVAGTDPGAASTIADIRSRWDKFISQTETISSLDLADSDPAYAISEEEDFENAELSMIAILDKALGEGLVKTENWKTDLQRAMNFDLKIMSILLIVSLLLVFLSVIRVYMNSKEKEAVQKELDKMNKDWAANFNSMVDMAIMFDNQGRVININRVFCETLKSGYDSIVGTDVKEVFQKIGIRENIAGLDQGRPSEVRANKIDSWFSVVASSVLDENNQLKSKLLILHNINESKKTEEELEERNSEQETFRQSVIDRELKMIELKKENRELKERLEKK